MPAEKPDPPADKPFAPKKTSSSVTLVWPGTTYDGGSIVTGYVVEMSREGENIWSTVGGGLNVFATSMVINNLVPETRYLFRVRCKNAVGISDPSDSSNPVVTTDKEEELEYDEEGMADDAPFETQEVEVKHQNMKDYYELRELLGRGKFGVVNKCQEKATKKILAAKFIKVSNKKEREEVENEISIMQTLQHPKLLQLYDAYCAGNNYVLIMELISGGELFERVVSEDFDLTERQCVFFMTQICEGMAYCHEKNVLHLDMKPENIMCVRKNSNRIKIIDFGLARKYNPKENLKVLFGTPEFVAPEVIKYETIDYKTDMWSIGVIAYVLLSGLSPFMGDTDAETLNNVCMVEWDFEDDSFDELSNSAKEFIQALLVKDRKDRMSAAECLQHEWLKKEGSSKSLSKAKLKHFWLKRKWMKAFNAVRALNRMGVRI